MLKLIFTLFFISIPAFAVDAIYTWGYGEDIKNILISIKFFTGNATYLIDTAIAIGLLLVLYKETQESNTDKIVKVAFLALVVSQLFFHSTKDYMVEDEVTNQAFAVTNVPVGIGELFSLFTTTERVLLKAFESSYSTPNSLNYSQVGLGFSMSAHLATNNAMFIDGNAHETFMDYTTNCIASGMLDGQINKNLIASENIIDNIRVSGFETLVYKSNGTVEQMSCQDSYDNYIVQYFQNESNSYIQNRIAAQMSLEPGIVDNALQDTSTLFFGISKSGKDYVMQQMGRNMLKKGLGVMAMTTGGDTQALAYSSALSSSTMENQWQQAGIMTQSTLPMTKAYLTSIVLAMTPLLALLSIMFGDWKYIKMIVTLLTTLMLFSPLASIINYLMYLKLEEIIPVISKGLWMPMLAMRDINSQIYSYLNYLGYAAMSIPILAYALVKASEQGFVNFMSGMGGAVSSASNSGASQKVTGANIGNTKVGGGSHTGENGTTTDMGGGSTQTDSISSSSEGTYRDQTTSSSNGNTNSTISNSVADVTMQNNELASVGYKNIGSEITQAHQSSYNEARATEKSSLESISNTLSSGLSTSMAKGQIFTNSDDFSKNTGINNADSRTIVEAQNEAIANNLNKKLSEAQTSSTISDAGFKLNGHAGWDAKDSFIGKISGVSAGVNGNFTISGTSTDGKSFSADMSKDEMASLQKSVSDSLSKTFTQDSGLALRASKSLADNEVFSSTALKSNMDAYTKAHSIAEKYSENYSKTDSNSVSFASKAMPEVTKQFIQNDERLKSMYESGNERAIKDAINDATHRIDKAFKMGAGADYNNLNSAFISTTGFDLKGNLSDLVNTQLNQGKNLDSNIGNIVSNGQNGVANTDINNSINQNPTKDYQTQSDNFKNSSNQDMNKHKEDTRLNTQDTIEKGNEVLKNHKDENDKSSRIGKSLLATGDGVADIGKGLYNLNDMLSWKTPGSDGTQEIKNSQKNWNENTDKLFGNHNNKPSNDGLADVKMQLDFIKDDLSEINSASTQIPEKKGGKK
ncbi:conjugal transfer protein TraG N-terminal domain-containing protein [Aliarcobacter butzleri]|uniref:Conjugal transfer protein TraG N-terminal domain-containing protein n=1 Tax=Aliarcobacter butzleri TaxID=28197 RepID=A0AAP4UZN9_9BACT|nr:conjugal transfer protein TraG N-terminal domain-containing protein [Aliarcobacter butzleri]MDN5052910.1 conjugal transfer protein TraG N-terminal domain-containing protein [Aliarcobacter butzleri]MDN5075811.1 conjugal transfer protein TraG N-terminal domain-containing protein [Aliarcobacter butzleri]MDN5117277.1 conjugal transfer protein TraG N-terminal domain-containing protein [Aliarcobacter butzleri]MDN5133087.1 conjugal transfer protein TraG N-terminal domain-containing protein [Aliarco